MAGPIFTTKFADECTRQQSANTGRWRVKPCLGCACHERKIDERQALKKLKTIDLDIAGLGLILYSPFSAADIREGDDYLETEFSKPEMVERQAMEGRIVGVSTGTGGRFLVEFYEGAPENGELARHSYKLRLGLEVRDRLLCIRDLYDLLDWTPKCLPEQELPLDNGFYRLTLLSNDPESGILGDDQVIAVYIEHVPALPKLRYDGVPTLC